MSVDWRRKLVEGDTGPDNNIGSTSSQHQKRAFFLLCHADNVSDGGAI